MIHIVHIVHIIYIIYLIRYSPKLYLFSYRFCHLKKDPASAGSNQSMPGIDVAIQKRQKLFAEHSAGVDTAELKSV